VRNLIFKMAMSIDGFVSDLDGRNTWMFGPDQGEGPGRRIYLERQPAHHGQPQLPGDGLPLFSELASPTPFKLMSSKVFPGGAVTQVYQPA
jgi:hypothetical protein